MDWIERHKETITTKTTTNVWRPAGPCLNCILLLLLYARMYVCMYVCLYVRLTYFHLWNSTIYSALIRHKHGNLEPPKTQITYDIYTSTD